MRRIWGILSVVFALFAALPGAELDTLLSTRAELFKMSGEAVEKNLPGVFKWMDGSKKRLRYNGIENKTPLTLFGIRVYEAIFDFADDKVSVLNVSVYNRGDGGNVTKKAFESLLETVQEKTSAFIGEDVKPQSQNMSAGGGSRLRSQVWRSGALDTVLRWSIGREQAEFIALDFYPSGGAPQSLRDGYRTSVGASELETRILNDEDGSRYVFVPMVDQGAKGYCVAATVERVLRYYGSNIDQHVIAKLAESDSQRGTSINKTVDALAGNQSKLGIKLKQLYRYDGLESYNDFKKLCKDYNSIARREKTKKMEFDDFTFVVGKIRYLDYGTLMKAMDFNVFREIRAKDRRESKEFFEEVRESIDEGVPLCWSTFIFPAVEKSGSEFGMHMRLITGYNAKTGEIIYSDSWGAGHEKKVMKPEDAWGITVNLIALEPRRR